MEKNPSSQGPANYSSHAASARLSKPWHVIWELATLVCTQVDEHKAASSSFHFGVNREYFEKFNEL